MCRYSRNPRGGSAPLARDLRSVQGRDHERGNHVAESVQEAQRPARPAHALEHEPPPRQCHGVGTQNLDKLQGVMQYAHLTVAEHRELLANAGYAEVQVFEEYDTGWLCVTGRKSASAE